MSPVAQPVVDPDSWTFSEPAALDLDESRSDADPSPWGKLLAEKIAAEPVRLRATRAMRCAASEVARFYLKYSAIPATPLRAAIVEHCGSLAADPMPAYVYGEAPAQYADSELARAWEPRVRQMLAAYAGAGARSLGIAFARDDKKATVVLMSSIRRADIEPLSRVVAGDGRIVVRGRSLVPAGRILALVNQGRHGFAACEADPGVRLPQFAYTCPLAPGDASARLVLDAFESGHVTGRNLVSIEAVREAAPREYRRAVQTTAAPVARADDLPRRLLELLNEVRAEAKLSPVTLSETQSATAAKLAPRYFEAITDPGKQEVLDVITLGLLAGWDVGRGPIRGAGFTAGAAGPSADASDWISAVLSDPGGRFALLDPSIRVVAFGPYMPSSPPMVAATFTGYAFFDATADSEVRDRFVEKLRQSRAAVGLPAPKLVTTLDEDAAPLAAELAAGELTPTNALTSLMRTGARVLNRSVQGFVFTGTELADVQLPDALLRSGRLELSITVSHYRPPGSPWGEFAVLVVIPGAATRA